MKAITLNLGVASSLFTGVLFAQEAPDPKPVPEIKAQIAMTAPAMPDQTFQFVGGQLVGGDPVKGDPYSAEAVTQATQTLADGSHIVNSTSSMIYRDSEGRERREESIGKLGTMSAEGAPVKAIFISDPVAKVSYSLDTTTHTAHKLVGFGSGMGMGMGIGAVGSTSVAIVKPGTTVSSNRSFSYSSGAAGPRMYVETHVMGGNDKAAKVENLGVQTMEGVQAEGTRTTVTIPAGQIGNERDINVVAERWYSQELQALIMSKHSDPRMGETTYKLTNINRAEPLHSMFEVPADYTIAEPPMIKVKAPKDDKDQNDIQ
jgi:hypothetical protein